jgi:hypothetical protein
MRVSKTKVYFLNYEIFLCHFIFINNYYDNNAFSRIINQDNIFIDKESRFKY